MLPADRAFGCVPVPVRGSECCGHTSLVGARRVCPQVHFHSLAVVQVNVAGFKRWRFWPAAMGPTPEEAPGTTLLGPARVSPDGAVTYEGLYLPPGYYHQVRSANGTTAVSWFAATPHLRPTLIAAAARADWQDRADDELGDDERAACWEAEQGAGGAMQRVR